MLVYVADDDAAIRELLCAVSRCEGHRAEGFSDGEALLQRVTVYQPDLILTDLQMPGLGGRRLVEELRRRPETAAIPVIVISGSEDEQDFPARHLVQGMVRKPFDLDEVIAAIAELARCR